jgi:hypothetical protein
MYRDPMDDINDAKAAISQAANWTFGCGVAVGCFLFSALLLVIWLMSSNVPGDNGLADMIGMLVLPLLALVGLAVAVGGGFWLASWPLLWLWNWLTGGD